MTQSSDVILTLFKKIEEMRKMYEDWRCVAIDLKKKKEELELENRNLKKRIHYLTGRIEELTVDMNCLKRFVKSHRVTRKF